MLILNHFEINVLQFQLKIKLFYQDSLLFSRLSLAFNLEQCLKSHPVILGNLLYLFIYLFIYLLSFLSWATPMAYGASQARGLIAAIATAYTRDTATWDLSHILKLHYISWQCQILNPLSKARNQTHSLFVPSHINEPLSHNGNSGNLLYDKFLAEGKGKTQEKRIIVI